MCTKNFQYVNLSGNNQSVFLDEVRKKLREDAPLPAYNRTPVSFDELHECLDFAILYEEAHGNRQIRDYCSSMVTRLRSLQERVEYAFLRHEGADVGAAVSDLELLTGIVGLERAVGEAFTKRNQVIIIDLNSVEDEIVELVSAVIAVGAFVFAIFNAKENPARAFAGTAAGIAFYFIAQFVDLFPNAMVSSIDSAFDMTLNVASSTNYTLTVMTVVAVLLLPVVLLYQAWTYWVFRHRLSADGFGEVKSPIDLLDKNKREVSSGPDTDQGTGG